MHKLFEKSSKLRNLRESVVGIDRIKDDPFANDRIELEQYEAVVKTVQATVERFHHTLGELNGVHGEMMGSLKRFYELNENVGQRKRIDSIDVAIDSIAEQYEKTSEGMEVLGRKLEALLAMHAGLELRLKERDKAHAGKAHYESKISDLIDSGDSEKVERNKKKQKEAAEEFEKTEEITIRECRDALNTKFKDMDQIVGIYLQFMCNYFGPIGKQFESISALPDEMMTSTVRGSVRQSLVGGQIAADLPVPEALAPEIDRAAVAKAHASADDLGDDDDRKALRAALGQRLKAKEPAPPQSDNDSDLTTPPRRTA